MTTKVLCYRYVRHTVEGDVSGEWHVWDMDTSSSSLGFFVKRALRPHENGQASLEWRYI